MKTEEITNKLYTNGINDIKAVIQAMNFLLETRKYHLIDNLIGIYRAIRKIEYSNQEAMMLEAISLTKVVDELGYRSAFGRLEQVYNQWYADTLKECKAKHLATFLEEFKDKERLLILTPTRMLTSLSVQLFMMEFNPFIDDISSTTHRIHMFSGQVIRVLTYNMDSNLLTFRGVNYDAVLCISMQSNVVQSVANNVAYEHLRLTQHGTYGILN